MSPKSHDGLREAPLALTASTVGGVRVMACTEAAEFRGVEVGQLLADARALCPDVQIRDADPEADVQALKNLSDWLTRYTPWAAPASGHNGADGVMLDITGCAHLFGGEEGLLRDLLRRLARLGIEARCGLASSLGAAWGLAHFVAPRAGFEIAPEGDPTEEIDGLPVAALRLDPEIVSGLHMMGLKTIRQLMDLPRAPLTERFGTDVAHRLDQALGIDEEPISPQAPLVPYRVKRMLAEPISLQDDLVEGLTRLARDLTKQLAQDRQGARRVVALFYRVDGEVMRLSIGTANACCDAEHLVGLFAEKLDRIAQEFDAGFGFDALGLSVPVSEDMTPSQAMIQEVAGRIDAPRESRAPKKKAAYPKIPSDLSFLMDRLGNRLGPTQVFQYEPVDSHMPERAARAVPVMAVRSQAQVAEWDEEASDRPLSLLRSAEPIEVVAEVPEGAPRIFKWRRVTYKITRTQGPERVAPEWWRDVDLTGSAGRTRDYFQVEDEEGRRFWLYRDGLYDRETAQPRWYVHGVFG
jgi:protein ImuB